MQQMIQFKQKDIPKRALKLPDLHVVVIEDWLKHIGDEAFLTWLKMWAWSTSYSHESIQIDFYEIIEDMNISKDYFRHEILAPLYNYGLIDLVHQPLTIIVNRYPQNDPEKEKLPLTKVRDYVKDFGDKKSKPNQQMIKSKYSYVTEEAILQLDLPKDLLQFFSQTALAQLKELQNKQDSEQELVLEIIERLYHLNKTELTDSQFKDCFLMTINNPHMLKFSTLFEKTIEKKKKEIEITAKSRALYFTDEKIEMLKRIDEDKTLTANTKAFLKDRVEFLLKHELVLAIITESYSTNRRKLDEETFCSLFEEAMEVVEESGDEKFYEVLDKLIFEHVNLDIMDDQYLINELTKVNLPDEIRRFTFRELSRIKHEITFRYKKIVRELAEVESFYHQTPNLTDEMFKKALLSFIDWDGGYTKKSTKSFLEDGLSFIRLDDKKKGVKKVDNNTSFIPQDEIKQYDDNWEEEYKKRKQLFENDEL